MKIELDISQWDELINILGEMVIGNNEGRWGDRIWSQDLLERLKRLKYSIEEHHTDLDDD